MFKEKRRLSVKLNENITDCTKSTVTVRGSSMISSQNAAVLQNTALEYPSYKRTHFWSIIL